MSIDLTEVRDQRRHELCNCMDDLLDLCDEVETQTLLIAALMEEVRKWKTATKAWTDAAQTYEQNAAYWRERYEAAQVKG